MEVTEQVRLCKFSAGRVRLYEFSAGRVRLYEFSAGRVRLYEFPAGRVRLPIKPYQNGMQCTNSFIVRLET